MKNLKYFAYLMFTAIALSLGACSDDDDVVAPEPEKPQPPVEEVFSLTIEAQDITEDAATIITTPSDNETRYVTRIFKSAEIKDLNDAALVEKVLADPTSLNIFLGKQSYDYKLLTPDTDYTAVGFDSGAASAKVYSKAFRTLKHEEPEQPEKPTEKKIAIEVKNIGVESAEVTFTPTDKEAKYFGRVVTEFELRSFARNEQEAIKYLIENPNHRDYIWTGDKTINPTTLESGASMVAIAFYYEDLSQGIFAKRFDTEAKEIKKEFTISNVVPDHQSVTMHVEPKYADRVYMETTVTPDFFDDPKENRMMGAYFGMQNAAVAEGLSLVDYIKKYGFKGAQDITVNHVSQFEMKPGTDYVTYFFYVDPENSDPTNVVDWNYTEVRYTTTLPTEGAEPKVELLNPSVKNNGNGTINIMGTLKANANCQEVKVGLGFYEDAYDKYLAEEGWAGLDAIYKYQRQPINAEALAAAKTAEGFSFEQSDLPTEMDGKPIKIVLHIEAVNAEGTRVFSGVVFDANGIIEKTVKK